MQHQHQYNMLVLNQHQSYQRYIIILIMSAMQYQCNVHGAMFTTQCSRRKVIFGEILCWVDNYRQPYNALPTGNQDIVSSLAQWGAN